jgi:hypothetical protein
VLKLKLSAECTSSGTHSWSITPNVPGACMTLANFFQGAPTQGMVQVTNINTCVVTALNVTHQFTCTDGTVLTETKTLNIPVQGIFIGRDGTTTSLTDYDCVLPGDSYGQSCVVYTSGNISVNKDFTFAFADIRVQPGLSGFDVLPLKTLAIRQTTVRGNADAGCQCLWRSIYVGTDAKLSTNTNSNIEDALYAIRAEQGSILEIRKTNFRRNFIGIRSTEGPFVMDVFEENDFDGTGPLYNICSLAGLNDIKVSPINGVMFTPLPYFNERGFAGMYLRDAGNIDLLQLDYNKQNTFHDLAVGIDAYDSEINIRRNCRFDRIHAGAYALPGGLVFGDVALRFTDSDAQGVNGIRFAGNGKFTSNPLPDFNDCPSGIFVIANAASAANAGTRVSVTGCRMLSVQQGVGLATSNGGFLGKTTNFFKGVFDNYFQVNPTTPSGLFAFAGIYHQDFSPTQSALEFAQNTIDVDQNAGLAGAFGIQALGFTDNTMPTLFQLDVNRNEININQGTNGIFLAAYARAWVHDNNGASGGGIFLNYNAAPPSLPFTTGITVGGNNNNLIGCNDVISSVSGTHGIRAGGHSEGTFVHNNINNGLRSVVFTFNCTGTRFACNTMTNYAENGLRYESGANTGQQGTFGTMTHGNRWVNTNPVLIGAFADVANGVDPLNSRFYVRNLLGENPTNNSAGWFTANVPNNVTPICYFTCPITAPQNFAPETTSWDDSVALGATSYSYYPDAARWADERNLYRKLFLHPELANNHAVMQSFVAARQNTAMGRLVQAVSKIDSLFAASQAQQTSLESDAQLVIGLLAELERLDSSIRATADSLALAGFKAQRDILSDELTAAQASSEAVSQQLTTQRLSGVAAALAYLASIAPTNAYEANEKRVLQIFLQSVVSGLRPSTGMLDTLRSIGSECPFVNGPVVYNARSLYTGFTGVTMSDVDCPEVGNRSNEQKKPFAANIAGIMLYPNPANDVLTIYLPEDFDRGQYRLTLSNVLGDTVSETQIYSGSNEVAIKNLPSGAYFARITLNGLNVLSSPFFIQH